MHAPRKIVHPMKLLDTDKARSGYPLGHERVGSGPAHVVIMNDWFCDTSTWDVARAYLDTGSFAFAFTDLRGYARSRGRAGMFTVEEAAGDVLVLADFLGWDRFAVVGHSMTALVALHLAQHHADRIDRAVVLALPPLTGFGEDDASLASSRSLALTDAATQLASLERWFGTRLSPGWTTYKASRWRAVADPVAVAAYVAMFARDTYPTRVHASRFRYSPLPASRMRRPYGARPSRKPSDRCAIPSTFPPLPTPVTTPCKSCRR
jgi:pimeloyl-ACP methyl ester carboxylesterase